MCGRSVTDSTGLIGRLPVTCADTAGLQVILLSGCRIGEMLTVVMCFRGWLVSPCTVFSRRLIGSSGRLSFCTSRFEMMESPAPVSIRARALTVCPVGPVNRTSAVGRRTSGSLEAAIEE